MCMCLYGCLFIWVGVIFQWPSGLLLHGPPGTGKVWPFSIKISFLSCFRPIILNFDIDYPLGMNGISNPGITSYPP